MDQWFVLFYKGATIISFGLLILALIFGTVVILQKERKWYLYYLWFIFIIELTTKLLILFKKENMIIYPFYVSGEFFILLMMFIVALNLSKKLFWIVGVISIILFSEAMILWLSDQNIALGIGKIISNFVIICMSAYYLIKALKNYNKSEANSFLIIYACLFLYYSISLINFFFFDQLATMAQRNAYILWGMKNLFSATLYGASLYTFFRLRR
jgi:hypothetical protein